MLAVCLLFIFFIIYKFKSFETHIINWKDINVQNQNEFTVIYSFVRALLVILATGKEKNVLKEEKRSSYIHIFLSNY